MAGEMIGRLEQRQLLSVSLVADINPGSGSSYALQGTSVVMNGQIYFGAGDGTHGYQLWKSDGTSAGTTMVADINPTGDANLQNLTACNGVLYFWADDGVHGLEPWRSDGTAARTFMLGDLNPGSSESFVGMQWDTFVPCGGSVYFAAFGPESGFFAPELYRTDGTAAGTAAVLDPDGLPIFITQDQSTANQITVANATLYVAGSANLGDPGLYAIDASGQASRVTQDTNLQPTVLADVNGTIFFADYGNLYTLDPATNQTNLVQSFPGPYLNQSIGFAGVGNTLFFEAPVGSELDPDMELWASDGTASGTTMLATINPGPQASEFAQEYFLPSTNGLFFTAQGTNQDTQLCYTDGTPAGTTVLSDFGSVLTANLSNSTVVDGRLFIQEFTPDGTGMSLYTSDGTPSGTTLLKTFGPAPDGSGAYVDYDFLHLGNEFYFGASDPTSGGELWETDGTPAGTQLAQDINPGPGDSFPTGYVLLNGVVYFGADDGTHGSELMSFDPGQTATGNDVSVQPIDTSSDAAPVGITFSDVTQAGETTVTSETTSVPPPAGFNLAGTDTYFELHTTATFTSAQVAFNFDPSITPADNLRLYHYDNGTWVDVTTSVDYVNHVIYGTVSSFSPFALVEPAPQAATALSVSGNAVYMQPGTLTATLTSSSGPVPNESISFFLSGVNVGTATTDSSGVATLSNVSTAGFNIGMNPVAVTASFAGDAGNAPSSAVGAMQIIDENLQGMVWVDFNNDGNVDFGEQGIDGITITLSGTDDLGDPISLTTLTSNGGIYSFSHIRPGAYTITEGAVPSAYVAGQDVIGTLGGTVTGQGVFSNVQLAVDQNALDYNFGQQPAGGAAVSKGQSAGIGFWANKNGQKLIAAFGSEVGSWLAATLPNTFGASAGADDLAGMSGDQVAQAFQQRFVVKDKLDAQLMASALNVYATNASLAGADAGVYGFAVSPYGLGESTWNVGANGAAFGVSDDSTLTVIQLLDACDSQAVQGVLYDGNTGLRDMALNVFGGINSDGSI